MTCPCGAEPMMIETSLGQVQNGLCLRCVLDWNARIDLEKAGQPALVMRVGGDPYPHSPRPERRPT